MPKEISVEEARELVAGAAAAAAPAPPTVESVEIDGVSAEDLRRLFTPKGDQLRRMRHDLRPGNEWRFGIRSFDEATLGGARPGQLVTLIGRSHTGKTLLAMNMVAKNRNHRTLWVSPDETETMFWGRYSSIRLEYNQKEWISRLIREDPIAWERVEQIMQDETNLHFESAGMSVADLDKALRIASTTLWGGKRPEVLVYDFLELIRGGETGDAASVQAKIESFKQLVSDWRVVGVIIHQSGRGTGNRGKAGGMEAGRYASTSESHFLIETWRRWDDVNLDEETRAHYKDEVSAGLWKNKSGDGEKAEVNLTIDSSGRILEPGVTWEQATFDD
jgi:KaiC/GvpD/RAD55 family RecA-like ATPase